MYLPFDHPLLLLLLPLAALPWWSAPRRTHAHASLALLPPDPLSDALGLALRAVASLAIAGAVAGLAAPCVSSTPTEHVGRGAEIVLVLDRSLSMDESFAGRPLSSGATGVDAASGGESKGAAARRLLADFAARRPHDLLAMLAFTSIPIRVIGFTPRQPVIQAAVAAGNLGHGIGDTDVGRALLTALALFHDRPYSGSRVLLLVSDGGARLDPATQRRIRESMQREHAALYWLYLRTRRSPGLLAERDVASADQGLVPEHFLHRFFLTMGSPYHAYEAENPDALAHAIADVDRLQSQPIRYVDSTPPQELARGAFGLALTASLVLLLAGALELRAP